MNLRPSSCILLLSGGMDSTLLAYRLVAEDQRPLCVTFGYDQRHAKETHYAQRVADRLQLRHVYHDIPIQSSSALRGTGDVPQGFAADAPEQGATVVPHRNLAMLAVAATMLPQATIYVGANRSDAAVYPDCRWWDFFDPFNKILKNTYGGEVVAPLVNMTKSEIVAEYLDRGIKLEESWSCYQGLEVPCGKCGPCIAISQGVSEWQAKP